MVYTSLPTKYNFIDLASAIDTIAFYGYNKHKKQKNKQIFHQIFLDCAIIL